MKLGAVVDGLRVVREACEPSDTIVVNGLQRVRPGGRSHRNGSPWVKNTIHPRSKSDVCAERPETGSETVRVLHRPPDLRGGGLDLHHHRRRDRAHQAAGQRVPGSGAAFDRRARDLPGRKPEGHRGHRRRAAGAGDRRRRGHALHVLDLHHERHAEPDRHLQARCRYRSRAGAGAEPRRAGAAATARGSPRPGRHHRQEFPGPDHGREPVSPRTAATTRCTCATTRP